MMYKGHYMIGFLLERFLGMAIPMETTTSSPSPTVRFVLNTSSFQADRCHQRCGSLERHDHQVALALQPALPSDKGDGVLAVPGVANQNAFLERRVLCLGVDGLSNLLGGGDTCVTSGTFSKTSSLMRTKTLPIQDWPKSPAKISTPAR